jgi:hypothetical protein
MAKVRVGCGWYVLLGLGAVWAVVHFVPAVNAPVERAVSAARRRLPPLPFLRPTVSPAPVATPAPQPTSRPEPAESPLPDASPVPDESPSPTPSETESAPGGALQTDDRAVGTGREAEIGCTARIRYSADGGLPVEFLFMIGADEVATGLDAGIRGMKVGGRRRLTIPAEQARGLLPGGTGSGQRPLICDLTLIEVL